jgi:hypothetical protein
MGRSTSVAGGAVHSPVSSFQMPPEKAQQNVSTA